MKLALPPHFLCQWMTPPSAQLANQYRGSHYSLTSYIPFIAKPS